MLPAEQEQCEQSSRKVFQHSGLRSHQQLPRQHVTSDRKHRFVGASSNSEMAAASLSAVSLLTGEGMMQMNLRSRHLSPFTEVVWVRGPRRWHGLRKGRYMRVEQPAPWLLGVRQRLSELQHHISEVPRRLSEMPAHLSRAQHHVTLPNLLIAAAVVAGLTLLVMLLQGTLQKQRQKQAVPLEDPEVLARKAASLDMQRNRFRRALGGEEDEAPADVPFSVESTSASASPVMNPDQSVTDKDDFAAWDDDTQKQWKRFMKGSRSQEIDEEQWWDIDRDELPPDRQVYQDFN